MNSRLVLLGFVLVAALGSYAARQSTSLELESHDHATPVSDSGGLTPRQLAEQYCQTCHVFPEPDILDKSTWITNVFPTMRVAMGLDTMSAENLSQLDPGVRHIYNRPPLMTEETWFAIAAYYIENAPTRLTPAQRPPIGPETPLFDARPAPWRALTPLFTHVRLDPALHAIILGDASQNRLVVCGETGERRAFLPTQGPPSCVVVDKGSWYTTDMANLLPHDSAAGGLYRFTWNKDSTAKAEQLLDTLRRPVHLSICDLNGDGKKEFLISEYGNLLGRLGYYEILPKGKHTYHLLLEQPGTIRTIVADLNHDGKQDVIALTAQAREGILAFINKGKGKFEKRELLTFHPAYGSSYFNLIDYNKDGNIDIVMTNGDNGDYKGPPYKPYHGVHIFLGDGALHFKESVFLPVNGAYGAVVQDFDLDGDLDVVSLAYFADFTLTPEEALMYWEHKPDDTFIPSRLAKFDAGRWLVFDANDFDGDGDVDIVVANTAYGPGNVPGPMQDAWVIAGVPFVYYRNTTR